MALYNWDYWRHEYVSGDDSVTLEALALRKNAPAFDTLKKRSTKESWTKQRENFRIQKGTIVRSDPTAIQAAEQVNELVNIAEMITQHTQIGKALQAKGIQWLKQVDPTTLPAREAIAVLKLGMDTQRLCAGLATEHQEITSGGKPVAPTRIEIVPLANHPYSAAP